MKLLFAPFNIIASRLAGITGRKITDRTWSLIDDSEPPKPNQRGASWGKLAAALILEGAVFRLVSGVADQAARRWFAHLTGRWPGEKPAKKPAGEDEQSTD